MPNKTGPITKTKGMTIRPIIKYKHFINIAFPLAGVNLHPKGFSEKVWTQLETGKPHVQHQ